MSDGTDRQPAHEQPASGQPADPRPADGATPADAEAPATVLIDDTAGVEVVDRSAHLAGAEGALLRADEVVAGYVPGVNILNRTDLYVREGELVGIIGPNGAGKSTLVKAIFGLVRVRSGRVTLGGDDITNLPTHRLVARGIGYVPQINNVFPRLTVEENLQMGTFLRPKTFRQRMDFVAAIFPVLAARRRQRAGSLSGGERQMVAMGRALMMEPSVLLLDEPSAGLSPTLQDEVFFQAKQVNAAGVTVVMVEQNARRCLQISERAYVLDQGRNAYTGTGHDLIEDPKVIELYLGTLAKAA
jgi:ABC-type branched-subunit amino acid transport system ATPase component